MAMLAEIKWGYAQRSRPVKAIEPLWKIRGNR
jgi:hypothetical protein